MQTARSSNLNIVVKTEIYSLIRTMSLLEHKYGLGSSVLHSKRWMADSCCWLMNLTPAYIRILLKQFVEIFQDPASNPNCAQMVFNAHDTELLNDHERFALGRDQVWFTEKSHKGESHIFPLSDFKGRREDQIGKRYLNGRYGAVPFFPNRQ